MKTKKTNSIKQVKNKVLDFIDQTLFIGIDVHKNSWVVTILMCGIELSTIRMNPSPEELVKHLKKNYPGAIYKSVYEAGFCGYWIDRRLRALGVENIIVNPADVPTKGKERRRKTDQVDSRKLARELSNGKLERIYVPGEKEESIRSLSRLRIQMTRDQTRIKNRIKSLLNFAGIKIPSNTELKHWSSKFIEYLENIKIKEKTLKYTLDKWLRNLREIRQALGDITKQLRAIVKEDKEANKMMSHLQSIPGIGFRTAITLYTEIMDINRFSKLDKLCAYVGLVPSVESSGEKYKVRGLSKQRDKYLRNMLIESTWTAVRKDPALTMKFGKLSRRMSKQEAIIRIAKKLLNRIMYVWREEKDYVCSVVE